MAYLPIAAYPVKHEHVDICNGLSYEGLRSTCACATGQYSWYLLITCCDLSGSQGASLLELQRTCGQSLQRNAAGLRSCSVLMMLLGQILT